MARILFPSDPLSPNQVDSAFEKEAEIAKELGFSTALLNLSPDNWPDGIRVPADQGVCWHTIYRGWMLTLEAYTRLYVMAMRQGIHLINSPAEYRYCHELPSWYKDFEGATPKSVWFPPVPKLGFEMVSIANEVQDKLGPGPYIIKGFVKSRKHEWAEACFIPGPEDIKRITNNFIELQGLVDGLVYRQYVPLRKVGVHPKSGAPIFNEIRTWTLSGGPLLSHPYWGPDEGGSNIVMPHGLIIVADLNGVGIGTGLPNLDWRVKSSLYTTDLAQLEDGRWVIIELGDGQVSGLPPHADVRGFYEGLLRRFTFE